MSDAYMMKLRNAVLLVLSLGLLAGCSVLPRKNAVPPGVGAHQEVEGVQNVPGIRYPIFSQEGVNQMLQDLERGAGAPGYRNDPNRGDTANYLSLSGGGDNGAFGAGLLTGWTKHGGRPEFDLVTGVSTGALIAPFAFLGPAYDDVLRQVYTEITRRDVFRQLGLMGALFGEAYADSSPLFGLISQHIDEEVLDKVAYQYKERNRWLLMATTDLDAGIPVLWNMGQIASVGTPEALNLFRKIMLASSSVPGAFPPVMFDVMVDDQRFQEMHVDGAASMQVFMYPSAVGANMGRSGIVSPYKNREVYIIRNARLDSDWRQIERSTLSIMGRSISQLINSQGYGDLHRIYLTSLRDDVGFNLAFIGPDFDMQRRTPFDPAYMQALYDYGHRLGRAGYPWMHVPPGFEQAVNLDVKQQVKRKKQVLIRAESMMGADGVGSGSRKSP